MRAILFICFCLFSLNANEYTVETFDNKNSHKKIKDTSHSKDRSINKYFGFNKCGSLALSIKCNKRSNNE